MTREEAVAAMLDVLRDLDVPHMVVGSLASNYHGVPRSTQDADLVAQLGDTSIRDVARCLGEHFRLQPQMAFETVTATTRYVFELLDAPFSIEIFSLSDDSYDRTRFGRRQPATIEGRQTFVLTAEDVIITKLRWAGQGDRRKDEEDVRNVIAVQHKRIDWGYVVEWCERHGTGNLLKRIRRSVPSI
ncbi:MAG: DUF6036 family nucleotidyltransferase [Planctomycetota bacterium]